MNKYSVYLMVPLLLEQASQKASHGHWAYSQGFEVHLS